MNSILAVALAALVSGGTMGGEITGRVTDGDTGLPIEGAVIALEELGRAAVTDASGWYRISDLPAGPHHLSVRLLGYRSHSFHVLVPPVGTLRVDLVLRTEPIEVEAVIVRGRIPIRGVEAEEPDLDWTRRLSSLAIRNDPFSPEPDVLEALVGGSISKSPESGGELHVRGSGAEEVGYLLDDIPVFSPYHVGVHSSAWNPGAVAAVELRNDPTLPTDALSGTVAASTIEPGDRLRSRGAVSTSQLNLALDGPLYGEAGYLLAVRSGFPGLVRPPDENSYLRGEDHDAIAKVQMPLAGGDLRLLGFDNHNAVRVSSVPTEIDGVEVEPAGRNRFGWRGTSYGVAWEQEGEDRVQWSARAWRARLDVSAHWLGEDPRRRSLESERDQLGSVVSARWGALTSSAEVGIRAGRDRFSYAVAPAEDETPGFTLAEGRSSIGGFVRFVHSLGERLVIRSDVLALLDDSGGHVLPRIALEWTAAERLALFCEYVRGAQASHSLRNAESVVGRIFPAELPVVGRGLPTARSHTGALGFVAEPWGGARLSGETYARSIEGLTLVAPQEGRPFAAHIGLSGSAAVLGGTVELSTSAARYALIASYGTEHVELEASGVEYAPAYAASHRVRLGAIAFPTPTLSVRLAWVAEFGRRGTDTIGALEWESCNLLDLGCEFAGTPEALGELGAVDLPAYQRLDASLSKHWHLRFRSRDLQLEVFTTASNLLGRSNVLTHTVDPETGERTAIEMRPRAPITLGVGWSL